MQRLRLLLIIGALGFSLLGHAASYKSLEAPPTPEDEVIYNQLTDKEKIAFQKIRMSTLKMIDLALHATRWSFGVGFVTADTVSFINEQWTTQPELSEEIKEMIRNQEYSPKDPTYKERAELLTQKTLANIDQYMWSKSNFISGANELAFFGSTGLQGLGKRNEEAKWGGIFDLGFSFGINYERKSLVFQIFRNKEKLHSSIMPAFASLGLVWKAGMVWSKNKITDPLSSQGTSFYPPGYPAAGFQTDKHLFVGASSGVPFAFWPPSPIGDLLTYSNNLENNGLFRFELSMLTSGFIRVSTDFKFIFEDFRSAFKAIQNLYEKSKNRLLSGGSDFGDKSCNRIFM